MLLYEIPYPIMQQRFQDKPPEIYKRCFAALSFPLTQLLFVIFQILQGKRVYFAFCHMLLSLADLLVEILLWPVSISVEVWHGPRKRKYMLKREKTHTNVSILSSWFQIRELKTGYLYIRNCHILFEVSVIIPVKIAWVIFHKNFLRKTLVFMLLQIMWLSPMKRL